MKKLVIIIIAIFISIATYSQSKPTYDTTSFVQCQIIKLERSMLVGNWLTIEASTGEIRYAIMNYVTKETRRMVGECILLAKDQWNDLPKNKTK